MLSIKNPIFNTSIILLSYQYKKGDNNLVEIILINKVHYDNYQSQKYSLSLLKSNR